MAEEFGRSVQDGLKLSKRIYLGKDRAVTPPKPPPSPPQPPTGPAGGTSTAPDTPPEPEPGPDAEPGKNDD